MGLAVRGAPGSSPTGDRMGAGRSPSHERRSGEAAIAVELTPVAEPAQERSWPSPLQIGLVLLACVVAGAVVGVVWEVLTPLPRLQVVGDRVLLPGAEDETAVAADGWFAVCAGVAGIVSAVAVFVRVREARISVLAGLTLGGLLAAVIAWRVGVAVGPDSVRAEAAGLSDGESFSGPLELSAVGVLFTWPLTAVITYFALAAGTDPHRPARGASSTTLSSTQGAHFPTTDGARFPTTVLGPGYAIDEVDSFFARLESGQVTADEAAQVRFSSTRLTRGYDEEAVDAALDVTRRG